LKKYFIYNEEADTPDENLSISAVFNAVQMLSNYMAMNNVSSKTNFKKTRKEKLSMICIQT